MTTPGRPGPPEEPEQSEEFAGTEDFPSRSATPPPGDTETVPPEQSEMPLTAAPEGPTPPAQPPGAASGVE